MAGLAGIRGLAVAARGARGDRASWLAWLAGLKSIYGRAFQTEADERRLFLWIPVAAGAGVVLYFYADREPSLLFTASLFALAVALAAATRGKQLAFRLAVLAAATLGGILCGGLREARVAAPVIDHIRIVKLTGFIEEMDFRRVGARFILRVVNAADLPPDQTPYRVRLTTPRTPALEAGAYVALTARLLPPARAALPGGYDFSRDAFFARLGAVGNALGRIEPAATPMRPDLGLRFNAWIDRARNALARRVATIVGGPAGAVGAAMVTGKRDFLDDPTRDVIQGAGIFHIITIAGVQMTLVAGIFFWGFRRLLALSRTLALNYPIKKWAAVLAMLGAIAYDIATGSRVGTERALYMTLIMLGAVVVDRRAISMRNLALAALAIIAFEPEALLGASFQLSFAAVAGLVAVYEARQGARGTTTTSPEFPLPAARVDRKDALLMLLDKARHGPGATLLATFCATSATASFMAYNFHELSPYVLIGNPLTLTIIEIFAVPGALLGAMLYPLGLDGFVWQWLGLGINFVLWAASWIAAMPAATVHLHEFTPWAIVCLALAVLSTVLWRTGPMRLTALPLAALGLWGATSGERFDVAIAPSGDVVAARLESGELAIMGRRPSLFVAEQWLRADADGRAPRAAIAAVSGGAKAREAAASLASDGNLSKPRCDASGCVATLIDGRVLSLDFDLAAVAEDCGRADIIVASVAVPLSCAADLVIDRPRLDASGAAALRLDLDQIHIRAARRPDEDRPWSPAPRRIASQAPREIDADAAAADEDRDQQAPPFR